MQCAHSSASVYPAFTIVAVGKKKEPEIAKAVPLLNVNENVSTSSLQSTSSRKSAASSKKAASVRKSKTAAVSDAAPKCTSFSTCCASVIKMYLIVYNAVSAVGWGYLLFQLAHSFFVTQPQNHRVLFGKTGVYLAHLQTAAVLEVLHAALGWVHSGVVSNAVQLTSRLFVAWIAALHAGTGQHWAYGMMATAWGLSDLTRYLYYLTQLLGCPAPVLKWARYTFFLVLYPVGTLGEAILIFLARLKWAADPVRNYGLLAVLAVYTPGTERFVT